MWGPVSVEWAACSVAGVMITRVQFSLFQRKAVDVLMRLISFRLWLFEFMSLKVSAGCEKGESPAPPPVFSFLFGVPRLWQQAPAGKGSHLRRNGPLCWSQIRLTGEARCNNAACNSKQAQVLSLVLWSSPGFFPPLAQEIHSTYWGRSHYECWRSSHLNSNEKKKKIPKKKKKKERDSCDCIIYIYIYFFFFC